MQAPLINQYWLISGRAEKPPAAVFGAWLYHDRYMRLLTILLHGAFAVSLSLILTVCTSVFLWQYPPDLAPLRTNVFLQMTGD